MPNTPLNETDFAILRVLQTNAKATVKEISQAVHLSSTPVHERIKRMESDGVITQYATLLNPVKVNRGLMVICYVSLQKHDKTAGAKFIDQIMQMTEVLECYSISGEFDFMLKVATENMESYYHFHVHKLSQTENIAQVQSVFVMGVVKQTHQLV